ncbi:YfiT family bacillithiol transferase [Ulvibacterium sp.]|uniref:YfiT family bacillithiol transferase n=1 Tax=Ulvibacterium sp. TaxID=2665914 RepID=UPI003BABCD75
MEKIDLEELRYPIGHFEVPENFDDTTIQNWISELEAFPRKLESLVKNLSDEQLDTVYRPGGWTVRQVVHHVSDSHHNSYMRFKWALTENRPIIKAYNEKAWADLLDTRTGPIEMSLDHLKAIHTKLVYFLRKLSQGDLERIFIHPESNAETSLKENIGRYVWHGNHHYAHIKNLLDRNNW